MKRSELKQLIREVVMEYNKSHTSHAQYDLETYVDLNYFKVRYPGKSDQEIRSMQQDMGWPTPFVSDVEVRVEGEGEWADNRFDYEFGNERGTHDPGSGFEATGETIRLISDFHDVDSEGNQLPHVLLQSGSEIKREWISPESLKHLEEQIQVELSSYNDVDSRDVDE